MRSKIWKLKVHTKHKDPINMILLGKYTAASCGQALLCNVFVTCTENGRRSRRIGQHLANVPQKSHHRRIFSHSSDQFNLQIERHFVHHNIRLYPEHINPDPGERKWPALLLLSRSTLIRGRGIKKNRSSRVVVFFMISSPSSRLKSLYYHPSWSLPFSQHVPRHSPPLPCLVFFIL